MRDFQSTKILGTPYVPDLEKESFGHRNMQSFLKPSRVIFDVQLQPRKFISRHERARHPFFFESNLLRLMIIMILFLSINSILVKWRINKEKEDRFTKESGSVYKLWCNNLDSIVERKVFFSGFEDANLFE